MSETLAGRRVLVVEDEYYLADDLTRALAAAGAEVVGPVNGVDRAMTLLATGPVDLAVLDINLKGERRFDLADHFAGRNIPFVFATGYDAAVIPEQHSHVPRWQKPYNTEALISALAELRRSCKPLS